MKEKNIVLKVCLGVFSLSIGWQLDNYVTQKFFYSEVNEYYSAPDRSIEFEEDSKTCDENEHKGVMFQKLQYHDVRSDCFLKKIKERKS